MLNPSNPDDGLRRRRFIILLAISLLFLLASVVYATLANRHSTPSVGSGTDLTVIEPPGPELTIAPDTGTLPELGPTADPETFARLVAEAIFEWDTTLAVPLADYTARLVAVADPTGESSPGLVADISTYLPPPTAWAQLRDYSTRQWLSIDTIRVPTLWATAETQAGDGLLPGTTAYTLTGVRHRTGVWEDEPVASAHDVAFTVFIVCAPSYPECRLLRLSRLDEPLD